MSKVVVYRPIDGITLNEQIECLLNEDNSVRIFASCGSAKAFLQKHGVPDEEMEHMMFLKSCGVCKRCRSPLFPSLLTEQGYKYQCFTCDEDFYAVEQ